MLIFGGTGFIGRHLCRILSAGGRKAVVVSRAPDLGFLKDYAPNVIGVELATMFGEAERYFRANDTLVYLASTSVPATYAGQPWRELTENVEPAFELLHRAHVANPQMRVVFLSSGGTIYGAGHSAPITESAPARPIAAYGYGKLAIEEAIRFLGRTAGLSYAILRVSNPVGRWQENRMQGVVAAAIRAAHSGETLNLFGEGRQIRDFLDADDLAQAIMAAVDARNFPAETWNIGSGVGRSIGEVLDLVSDVTGYPIHRINRPPRAVDIAYSVLDASKAKRDLGWSVQTSLRKTVESIERVLSERQEEGLP